MKSHRAAALVLVMVVLLSGCMKVDGKIKIKDDGSGSIDYVIAMDPEFLVEELTGEKRRSNWLSDLFGPSVCDELDLGGLLDELPDQEGAEVSAYDDDGFCGVRAKWQLEPSLDHSVAMSELFSARGRLAKVGENWIFDVDFHPDDLDRGEISQATSDVRDSASYRVRLELPGAALDGKHNATSVDGGTFTWDIDLNNPPARLFAETEPGPGFQVSAALMGTIAGLSASLAALAWFFLKGDGPTAGATATNTATAGAEPSRAYVFQPEPFFSQALGQWFIDDPVQGRLRHDPATDAWQPA